MYKSEEAPGRPLAPAAVPGAGASDAARSGARGPDARDATDAMTRYAQGDDRAFEQLYAALAARLHRFCVFLAGRFDAADLMQEVFLKIHRARATFMPGGNAVAWAFAIARTTYLDRMRHRKRRPEDLARDSSVVKAAVTTEASPEAISNTRALEEALEERLANMPETLRSALILVRIEGMSCEEAAAVLGTSSSAVKQRVFRASALLRATLGPDL